MQPVLHVDRQPVICKCNSQYTNVTHNTCVQARLQYTFIQNVMVNVNYLCRNILHSIFQKIFQIKLLPKILMTQKYFPLQN